MYTLHFSQYTLPLDDHQLPLWEAYEPVVRLAGQQTPPLLIWVKQGILLPEENLTEVLAKYTVPGEPWCHNKWLATGKLDPNDFAYWRALKKEVPRKVDVDEESWASLSRLPTRDVLVRAPDGIREVRRLVVVEKYELR
jgi:hypothetical protein